MSGKEDIIELLKSEDAQIEREKETEEDKVGVDVILRFSERLYHAYVLKELFFQFADTASSSAAAELLAEWFDVCGRLQIPEFSTYKRILKNWKSYILNTFDGSYSNAVTEDCINATNALKCAAFSLSFVIFPTSALTFYRLWILRTPAFDKKPSSPFCNPPISHTLTVLLHKNRPFLSVGSVFVSLCARYFFRHSI